MGYQSKTIILGILINDKSSKTKFSVETFTSKGGEKKIKLVDTIYDTVRKCGLCGSYPGFHPFFKYVSQH